MTKSVTLRLPGGTLVTVIPSGFVARHNHVVAIHGSMDDYHKGVHPIFAQCGGTDLVGPDAERLEQMLKEMVDRK